ncbi:MAG: class F sortase [Actinomycetales bacterium]
MSRHRSTPHQRPADADSSRGRSRLLLAGACLLAVFGAGAVTVAATRGPELPVAPPVAAATSSAQTPGRSSAESASAAVGAASSPRADQPGKDAPVGKDDSAGDDDSVRQSSHPPYAAALPRSRPTHLRIPAIGVDTPLIALGLSPDGTMAVPAGPRPAGWFTGSPTPGSVGPAVLAGHVTYNGPGVFFHLGELTKGQRIEVTRADGHTAVFTVYDVETYPKDAFPTARVYGNTDGPELRLITCAGDYDSSRHHYADNAVVYASLTATR